MALLAAVAFCSSSLLLTSGGGVSRFRRRFQGRRRLAAGIMRGAPPKPPPPARRWPQCGQRRPLSLGAVCPHRRQHLPPPPTARALPPPHCLSATIFLRGVIRPFGGVQCSQWVRCGGSVGRSAGASAQRPYGQMRRRPRRPPFQFSSLMHQPFGNKWPKVKKRKIKVKTFILAFLTQN